MFKGRLKEFILIISAFVLAMSFYRAYDVLVKLALAEKLLKKMSIPGINQVMF